LLDVKVWDDETDLKELEEKVRSISIDGLVWGSSKLVPVAFNIKKLHKLNNKTFIHSLNFI
jgi:elongation factor 1-beta